MLVFHRPQLSLTLVSFLAAALIQGALAQGLWQSLCRSDDPQLRAGILYLLFCLLISGANCLSAALETPEAVAARMGWIQVKEGAAHSSKVLHNILNELCHLQPAPSLFLVPGGEVNAFCLRLGLGRCEPAGRQGCGTLLLTQGAVEKLNRTGLKMLIARQIAQLHHPSTPLASWLALGLTGFCTLYFSGVTLLKQCYWKPVKGRSPLFSIGILPLVVGLPGWWLSRLLLLLLDKELIEQFDAEVCDSQESAKVMAQILRVAQKQPIEVATSCWLLRSRGFHNESFLERVLPTQPSLQQRLAKLEQIGLKQ